MNNICKNCGYKYNPDDVFCARCGTRLAPDKKIDLLNALENFQEQPKKKTHKKKKEFFNPHAKNFFDNTIVCMTIFLAILTISVSVLLLFVIKKHDKQKDILQYKNYILNPVQIPLLKEPFNYTDLFNDFDDVEKFLISYFEYSNDSIEMKMQIFASFLKELDKVSNVLNYKFSPKDIKECSNSKNGFECCRVLNSKLSKVGIKSYLDSGSIYLFPDYKFFKNKFYKYLDFEFRQYISYRSKYSSPVSFNLALLIEPDVLAEKIYAAEKLCKNIQNSFIKETLEKIIYNDFRKFIFSPFIYATTTQEMKPEFERAYKNFIKNHKDSSFKHLIMSYLDKKRAYNEDNFKKDYPLKLSKNDFNGNIEKAVLNDVFAVLRKNAFADSENKTSLSYVYDIKTSSWKKYNNNVSLNQGEYVISEPDENNNVSIFNYLFSPMQELNIYKYSKLYLINNCLYAFNKDKLSLLKITFNGKTFNLYNLSNSDITSLFPGVELINMDGFSNYNILIEKENKKASYIIISRYSQGWNDYDISVEKGQVNILTLPNMFSVNSDSDVVLSFKTKDNENQEISENAPSYKFTIKTHADEPQKPAAESYVQFDEKTKLEEYDNSNHKPNIMPKLIEKSENIELEEAALPPVPLQNIEPPLDEID